MGRGDGAILLVDDDPCLARSYARQLRQTRACVIAKSVAEAKHHVTDRSKSRWCGFLVDVYLDDGMGFEVVEAVREQSPDSLGAPAVLMSGQLEKDRTMVERAHRMECAFLAKPVVAKNVQRFLVEAVAYDVGLDAPLRSAFRDVTRQYALSPNEADVLARGVMHEPPETMIRARDIEKSTYREYRKRLLGKMGAACLPDACRRVMMKAGGREQEQDARRTG